MAHFGNCDPETADQEYCIFHKPNKSEEEAVEFYRKFLERFKPRVEEIEVEGQKIKRLVFEKPVDARGFVFPKLELLFGLSIFNGNSDFRFSIFEKYANFSGAVFKKTANFGGAVFRKYADFSGARFLDRAYFWEVVFWNYCDFVRTEFQKDVTFWHAEFKRYADFTDASFGGILHFEGNIIRGIRFDNAKFTDPRGEKSAYGILRKYHESEGDRESADYAFVLEMRAKRRARIKNARTKLEKLKAHTHNFIEWLLADLPSEYGTNWVRLFLFSLLVIIGNAVPYTLWSAYIEGFPQTSNYFIRFANALYYSLVTFTTLGYGDMHPTGWLKALSALEALTGAVFMALIVAVIARKWMR